MRREVLPELLDSLPHDDPEALRNRRELRLINALMGNYRWFARQVRDRLPAEARALELGAGEGELGRYLARRGAAVKLDGLDLCPVPAEWGPSRGWIQADLKGFDGYGSYHAVFANLILHQFKADELAAIGSGFRDRVGYVFASEPARRVCHLAQFRALSVLGRLGRVSRHDGAASIRAGFRGDELPRLLGLNRSGDWKWVCRSGWLGQYRLVAWRTERQ